MRRWIVVVAFLVVAATSFPVSAATPELVRDEPEIAEQRPSRSDGYLVWSAFDLDTFRAHSWVMPDGGDPVRVDPVGTLSGTAVIDGRPSPTRRRNGAAPTSASTTS